MEIDTTISIDSDELFNEIEHEIRTLAEEVMESNHMDFQDSDDVNNLIDEKVHDHMVEYCEAIEVMTRDDTQELIDESWMDVNDLIALVNEQGDQITVLRSRVRVIEGYLTQIENRRPGTRLKRLGGVMSRMARKVHWHMPRR